MQLTIIEKADRIISKADNGQDLTASLQGKVFLGDLTMAQMTDEEIATFASALTIMKKYSAYVIPLPLSKVIYRNGDRNVISATAQDGRQILVFTEELSEESQILVTEFHTMCDELSIEKTGHEFSSLTWDSPSTLPVSYTHLTLPTKRIV